MRFLLFAGWWTLLLYLFIALWRGDLAEVGSFGNFIGVGLAKLVGREMGFFLLFILLVLSIKIYRRRVDQRVATLFLGLLLLWFGGELLQGLLFKKGALGVVITDYFLRGFGFIGTLIGYIGILASGFYLLYEEGGAGVSRLSRYLRILFKLGRGRVKRWWVGIKAVIGGWRPKLRWRYWIGEIKNLLSWGPKRRLWQLRREIKEEVARRGLEVKVPSPAMEEGGVKEGEVNCSTVGKKGGEEEKRGSGGETPPKGEEESSSTPPENRGETNLGRELPLEEGETTEGGTSAPLYPLTLLNRSYSPPTSSQTEGERYRQVLEEVLTRLQLNGKVQLKGEGPLLYLYKIQFKTPVSTGIFRRLGEEVEELFWERRPFLKLESFSEVEVQLLRRRRRKLYLRELLELDQLSNIAPNQVLIGVDPVGAPLLLPLSELKRVLITGEDKSGKTLFLGALLLSLLYRNSPSSLQLLLFNRDRGEGVVWGGIPHLITPPISELVPLLESLSLLVQNTPEIPTIVIIEGLELVLEEGGGELLRKLGEIPNLHLWATIPARELEIGEPFFPFFHRKIAFKMDRNHSELLFQSPVGEYLADFGDGVIGEESRWERFHPPYLRRLEIRKVLNYLRTNPHQ
ncbi:MAG: FtsK/SpoIIIE domain-containing protein [Campylobacterales bacterium]